jgi:hypothetical protein
MRTRSLLVPFLLLALSTPAAARPRTIGCCLEVFIPGISTEPRCLVVNLRVRPARVSPRRVCRLAGGDPVRRGTCRCPGLQGTAP